MDTGKEAITKGLCAGTPVLSMDWNESSRVKKEACKNTKG